MERNNLVKVIEEILREDYFHGEWQLIWDEKHRSIEVIFQQCLENEFQQKLKDGYHNETSNDKFLFELNILFYSSATTIVATDNYFKTIPIDEHTGIVYGDLFAIFKYLQQIIAKIPLQWRDCLQDSQEIFVIKWEDKQLRRIRQSLIDNHRYAMTSVFFPTDN